MNIQQLRDQSPSRLEKQALVGSYGIPGKSNTYVTETDPAVNPFGGSGTNHSEGIVPDPGSLAGTTRFLREDGTWASTPPWAGDADVLATGATRTQVADVASDVQLLAANVLRAYAVILNTSSATLFLSLGPVTASLTDYTYIVDPNNKIRIERYGGEIRGIWDTDPNTGEAQITEATADSATGYSASAARTQISAVGSDTLFLSTNTARRKAYIFNDNAVALLIGEGISTVTSSSFSHRVQPNETLLIDWFTGQIRGMWEAGFDSGKALVTECT